MSDEILNAKLKELEARRIEEFRQDVQPEKLLKILEELA